MPALDILFPPRCAACDAGDGWPLCAACTRRVGVITPPWCERCGRPLDEAVRSCRDCPPPVIDRARAPFLYEGPLASAIKAMKFAGSHGLAPHLGAAIAELVPGPPAEVLTWVPLSRRRRSRRGFDQAEEIARALARLWGIPARRLLVRTLEATSQARRSGAERRAALRGAFRSSRGSVPARVVLVDDVLTTGSTAAACAGVLKARGARHVTVLTAARSLGGAIPARCRAVADPVRARVR